MLCGVLALGPAATRAGDDSKSDVEPADDELIEFLGSVGSEDDDWLTYLAHTDPTKVATKSPPPADGDKKNE
jgi:hypothetical protein